MRKLARGTALAGLCLVVSGAAPSAAQEDPAALVVRLQGAVEVSHGGGDPAPAAVGLRLAEGDRVVPGEGGRAILLTRGGATVVVTEPLTVSAPAQAPSDMFARAVSTLAQAATRDVRTVAGRQGMIRPIPGEPVLVAPRNGLTVADVRPTFRWMEVEGSEGYTLQLRKADGGRPVRFQVGATPEWTLPAEEEALEHGAVYAWTVAPDGGRPTREQRFRVIGADEEAEMRAVIGEVEALGLDPASDGAFLTAIVYRDLDLPYRARAALETVEASGDIGAELYLLKGDILNLLGHAEEARAAFEKADGMMR